MSPAIATNRTVDRPGLQDFLRDRHRGLLITTRDDGGLQVSPVTCGVDGAGRVVIATYPDRAKAANLRKRPAATMCVLSDDWNGAWVQFDGTAEVIDMPDALDPLVDYFRCVAGEHPDWADYRAAMHRQNKSVIRITITHWGPIATGGFPPHLATTPS